jgi:lysozyme
MADRSINQNGIDLLKELEGCKLCAYRDIGGVLTIGYGQTGSWITPDTEITQDQAEQLLRDSIAPRAHEVSKLVTHAINDNQFAALVCFVYNEGAHNLQISSLLRELNKGNIQQAADDFLLFNKVRKNGVLVYSQGLMNRRQKERALFLQEDAWI